VRHLTKTALFVFLLALCACWSTQVIEQRFGRFILSEDLVTEHWDWEGGNTHVDEYRFCRDDGQMCVKDGDGIRIDFSKEDHVLAMYANSAFGLYEVTAGTRFECHVPNLIARLRIGSGTGYWLKSSEYVFFSDGNPGYPLYPEHEMHRFSLHGDLCHHRIIKTFPNDTYSYFGEKVAADRSGLAWIWCEADCSLQWIKAEEDEIHSQALGCTRDKYLDLEWIGDHPEPRHYWSANGKTLCLDDEGKPKFPILPEPNV
jgi:hypothetical protein